MINSLFHISLSAIILDQAIADVNKSIIFDRHLLQKTKHIGENIQDFVSVNDSANGLIRKVACLQTLMQNKLQNVEELLQRLEKFYMVDNPEEAAEGMANNVRDDELEK